MKAVLEDNLMRPQRMKQKEPNIYLPNIFQMGSEVEWTEEKGATNSLLNAHAIKVPTKAPKIWMNT